MSAIKKALVKWKAGQRMEYPPSGAKYKQPSVLGKVKVK